MRPAWAWIVAERNRLATKVASRTGRPGRAVAGAGATLGFPLDWRFGDLGTLLDEVAINGERAIDIVDATLMIMNSRPGAGTSPASLDFALRAVAHSGR